MTEKNPETNSEDVAENQQATNSDDGLDIGRLRSGHIMLAFTESVTKRQNVIAYMRNLEHKRVLAKDASESKELAAIYKEVKRLDDEVIAMVGIFNGRFESTDQKSLSDTNPAGDVGLYSNEEFFEKYSPAPKV